MISKKVIFKSHKISIAKEQANIAYEDIKKIVKRKTARLIDSGIRIITNNRNEFNFAVNERRK